MDDQSQVQSVDEQGDRSLPTVPYVWADNHEGRMLNLLKTGIISDLTLLVGPQRTPIKAHSLILITGSQTFENKLNSKMNAAFSVGALNNVQELLLEDQDPEIFQLFLEKLYTGKCQVEITQALPLLKTATDYGVMDLIDQCSEILQGDLNDENVIIIFSQAMEYFNKDLIESSLKYICKNATSILNSGDFANLRLECLVEILKQDDLKVKNELEVFTAAYKWGEAECKRQKLDPNNPKDLRKVLNKALAYIRFPNMRQNDFALEVATKSLLDEGELMSLMISFMVSPSERSQLSSGRFTSTTRTYSDIQPIGNEDSKYYVSRRGQTNSQFVPHALQYEENYGVTAETLLFSVSQSAYFCGIQIAKNMFCLFELSSPGEYCYQFDEIEFTITLSKVSDGLDLSQNTKNFDYDVCFDTAIKLEANQLYKIHLSCYGPIKYKEIASRHGKYVEISLDVVEEGEVYSLQVGTGYKPSDTFTARNSVIDVKFSRDPEDEMNITEGFIEKLIFQIE